MGRIYSNALILIAFAFIASALFSIFANDDLAKAAFIGATTLSGSFLSVAMVFAGKTLSSSEPFWKVFSPINFNVLWAVAFLFAVLGVTFIYIDTAIYTDSVMEGLSGATFGGIGGIIMSFAKKDQD